MKITILAVGNKMPSWVTEGYREYIKRFPREIQVELQEIAPGNRNKNADVKRAIEKESQAILSHISPKDWVVALEVRGKNWSTEELATEFDRWRFNGANVVILIGGPEGLSKACKERANQLWSMSALTFPHPIVRVILAESLYRAWTVTQNHPYHRA